MKKPYKPETVQSWRQAIQQEKEKAMHPETIPTETPEPPAWVAQNKAACWAWKNSLEWRANAARDGQDPQWRSILLQKAHQMYANHQERQP